MINKKVKNASILNILINIFLMFLNLFTGIIFSSISFISKGIESFQDVLTAVIIYFSIKLNNKEKDSVHQFGHTRAENIAGYSIGVIMILLGLEVVKTGIDKILNPQIMKFNFYLFIIVFIALFLKLFLYFYIKQILKINNSPALKANLQDHLNDILMYLGLFFAVLAIKFGYYLVDPIIAIIIGFLILKSGYNIVKENISYLMGTTADKKITNKIKKIAINIDEVLKINLCKTQYLGNKIQVEIHIALNSKIDLTKAHNIGNQVRDEIVNLDEVVSCFVHIDPYVKN